MTNFTRYLTMAVVMATLAAGCSNDMNADRYTFACEDDDECAADFYCGPSNVCIERGSTADIETMDADTATEDVSDTPTEDVADSIGDTTDTRTQDADSDAVDAEAGDTSGDASDTGGCDAPTTFYLDCDNDEYAGGTTEACTQPTATSDDCVGEDWPGGWKTADQVRDAAVNDCDDADDRAFPNQEAYFTEERASVGGYDFNCDGTESLQWEESAGSCVVDRSVTCGFDDKCELPNGDEGWPGDEPNCGESGTWIDTCAGGCQSTCEGKERGQPRTQACR